MALTQDQQVEIQFVINSIGSLANILVGDAKNTTSELTADTQTDINNNIQKLSDYLQSIVPTVVQT